MSFLLDMANLMFIFGQLKTWVQSVESRHHGKELLNLKRTECEALSGGYIPEALRTKRRATVVNLV